MEGGLHKHTCGSWGLGSSKIGDCATPPDHPRHTELA